MEDVCIPKDSLYKITGQGPKQINAATDRCIANLSKFAESQHFYIWYQFAGVQSAPYTRPTRAQAKQRVKELAKKKAALLGSTSSEDIDVVEETPGNPSQSDEEEDPEQEQGQGQTRASNRAAAAAKKLFGKAGTRASPRKQPISSSSSSISSTSKRHQSGVVIPK